MGAGDVAGATRCLRAFAAAALVWAAAAAHAADLEAGSADGRWILRADSDGRVLLAIDPSTGATVRRIAVADRNRTPARVARVLDAPPRRSFMVMLADVPEAWELGYGPDAEPVYTGLVHDFRMREGIAEQGPLPVRRIHLDHPLTDVLFSPQCDYFVGRATVETLHVVSLAVRRRIETITVDGDPVAERGVSWQRGGHALFALPDRSGPAVHVLDGRTWRWRARRALPAVAMRLRREGDVALVAELADGSTARLALDSF